MDIFLKEEANPTASIHNTKRHGWLKNASINIMSENNPSSRIPSNPSSNHVDVNNATSFFPNNFNLDPCLSSDKDYICQKFFCNNVSQTPSMINCNNCTDCFELVSTNMKQLSNSKHLEETAANNASNPRILQLDLNIRKFHKNMNQNYKEVVVDFDVVSKQREGTCSNLEPNSQFEMTQLQNFTTTTKYNTCDENENSFRDYSKCSIQSLANGIDNKIQENLDHYQAQDVGFNKPQDFCLDEPQDCFSEGSFHTITPTSRFYTNMPFENKDGMVSTSRDLGLSFENNNGCEVDHLMQNVENVGVPIQQNQVGLYYDDDNNNKFFKGQHDEMDENISNWEKANMESSCNLGFCENHLESVHNMQQEMHSNMASLQQVEEEHLCNNLEYIVPNHTPLILNGDAYLDSLEVQVQRFEHEHPLEHNSTKIMSSSNFFEYPYNKNEKHGIKKLGDFNENKKILLREKLIETGVCVKKTDSATFDDLKNEKHEIQNAQNFCVLNENHILSPTKILIEKNSSVNEASQTSDDLGKSLCANARRSKIKVDSDVNRVLKKKLANTTRSTITSDENMKPILELDNTKTSMRACSSLERNKTLNVTPFDVENNRKIVIREEEKKVQLELKKKLVNELENELENGLKEGFNCHMESMEKKLFELFTKAQNETKRLVVRVKAERWRGDIPHVSPQNAKALKKRVEDYERVCKAKNSKHFGGLSMTVYGNPRQPTACSTCKFCNLKYAENLETAKCNNFKSTVASDEEITRLIEKNRLESDKLAQRICYTLHVGSA